MLHDVAPASANHLGHLGVPVRGPVPRSDDGNHGHRLFGHGAVHAAKPRNQLQMAGSVPPFLSVRPAQRRVGLYHHHPDPPIPGVVRTSAVVRCVVGRRGVLGDCDGLISLQLGAYRRICRA